MLTIFVNLNKSGCFYDYLVVIPLFNVILMTSFLLVNVYFPLDKVITGNTCFDQLWALVMKEICSF